MGKPFSTFVAGGRSDAIWGPLSAWLAYTQTGSAEQWRFPYGVWIGYTSQLEHDFARAGERTLQVGAAFDFKSVDLPGLLLIGSATLGDRAIVAATGRRLPNVNEYNVELTFRADFERVPAWLKPLQLRARAAYIDEFLNGTMTSRTQYRLYFNYELTFKGPRRSVPEP